MPKMLENVREMLIAETKAQINAHGYAATTVRSIAGACGIAVGTVYNYFPSKEMMVACYVAEDWREAIRKSAQNRTDDAKTCIRNLSDLLCAFVERHDALFRDKDAKKVFRSVFEERHHQLRNQIADLILPVCDNQPSPAFLAQFIAEALLTWTMAGTPFDQLYSVIEKLL